MQRCNGARASKSVHGRHLGGISPLTFALLHCCNSESRHHLDETQPITDDYFLEERTTNTLPDTTDCSQRILRRASVTRYAGSVTAVAFPSRPTSNTNSDSPAP